MMKKTNRKMMWRRQGFLARFWLKLLLGLGFGLVIAPARMTLTGVSAQIGAAPFPGTLVAAGTWSDLQTDQSLIRLSGNKILLWAPASGQYRLWQYDPIASRGIEPPAAQAVGQGALPIPGPGYEVVDLGGNRLLTWKPVTGQYIVWQYDPTTSRAAGPLSGPAVAQGTLSDIRAGYRLIYLGSQKVLAWEPASGRYQVWRYDPTIIGQVDAFPGELMVAGNWPTIGQGHKLIYLGSHRLLDWEPDSGHYRIWRYDPLATGQANPLVGQPVVEGTLSTIGAGYELLNLGHNRLLTWAPVSGQYRIWQYEFAAIGAFSLDDIAAKLSAQSVTGLTVITHGFQLTNDGGDSLLSLAEAIHQRDGGWLLDYDVPDDGENGFFDTCTNDCGPPSVEGQGEIVLLFDWAPESNELSDGWGEAAGDALFSMLVGLGLIEPIASNNIPLHFIGHSFGTAVTGEAVERLARFGVPVDHLTYLDPHDFDQAILPVDESQRLFDLGQPDGYGATVWQNVTFADVYYQTRTLPDGRPIPGAYNKFINDLIPLTVISPHSYVWECFYLATVMGAMPAGCDESQPPPNYTQTGYAFSRLAGGQALRPAPVFYGTDQNHEHSQPELVDTVSGQPNQDGLAGQGLTAEQVTQGRWQSVWNPLTIVNGDFEKYNGGVQLCAGPTENTCPQPGWTHHGGGGSGHFNQDTGNAYLILDAGNTTHAHNWLYVPAGATGLRFDLRRNIVTSVDSLEVRFGNQTVGVYALDGDDSDFITQEVEPPQAERGQTTTLTFQIVQEGLFVGSEAWIDNVQFLGSTDGTNRLVYLPLVIR